VAGLTYCQVPNASLPTATHRIFTPPGNMYRATLFLTQSVAASWSVAIVERSCTGECISGSENPYLKRRRQAYSSASICVSSSLNSYLSENPAEFKSGTWPNAIGPKKVHEAHPLSSRLEGRTRTYQRRQPPIRPSAGERSCKMSHQKFCEVGIHADDCRERSWQSLYH
jgi:hypothetical protein